MTHMFYLLRHAEAEPHSLQKADKERSLTARGLQSAEALGASLALKALPPWDAVWCSDAIRTRQTLEALERGWQRHHKQPIAHTATQWTARLYHASAAHMLEILALTEPGAKHVLMVGHNPGISELAAYLAKYGDAKTISDVHLQFPTCAMAMYRCDISNWAEITPDRCMITDFRV